MDSLVTHREATIFGLRRDDRFRVNIGIVNLDPATEQLFYVRVPDSLLSQPPETYEVTVPALAMEQITLTPPRQPLMFVTVTNVTPDGASGRWLSYGSSVDNVTGDAWSHVAVPGAEHRRVPFETVYASQYSGLVTPRHEAISSRERWLEVWREIHSRTSPEPPLPVVDFTTHSLLLAALGESADACWDIQIAAVEMHQGAARVFVRRTRSRRSCSCPPVTVQPVHVVRIAEHVTSAAFSTETVVGTQPCN